MTEGFLGKIFMFKVKGLTLAVLAVGVVGFSQLAFSNENEKCSDYDSTEFVNLFQLKSKETSFEFKLKERNAAVLQAQLKSLDWIRQKTTESKRAALNYLFAAEKASYEMLLAKTNFQDEQERNNCFN